MLPILRWAEVAPLAACGRRYGDVAFDPRALYLLFSPLAMLSGAEDLDAARRELTQAWGEVGLLDPDKVAWLVERVTWVDVDIHWRRDETLGWITGVCHSLMLIRAWLLRRRQPRVSDDSNCYSQGRPGSYSPSVLEAHGGARGYTLREKTPVRTGQP
jgi:hypothetical protein